MGGGNKSASPTWRCAVRTRAKLTGSFPGADPPRTEPVEGVSQPRRQSPAPGDIGGTRKPAGAASFWRRFPMPGRRGVVGLLAVLYLGLAAPFAVTPLDIDEFTFMREPYEVLGGDYTMGYLRQHDYGAALRTGLKAYYFFWQYRPLNAPVIAPRDRTLFAREEKQFGYVRPDAVTFGDPAAMAKYRSRLIVPEPDRFYSHGAGKPLLPALLSVPQMALLDALHVGSERFLAAQYGGQTSWIFLVIRLVQLFAGAAAVLLVFRLLDKCLGYRRAVWGTLIFASFPVTIKYFPNIHHDSILVPWFLLAVSLYLANRHAAGGVAYGLALASKNLAIILAPALLIDACVKGLEIWRQDGRHAAQTFLRRKLAGLAVMGCIAFATLLPFANPISYAQEVLTPVISRKFDPRGENLNQWTVQAMAGETSPLSPQVSLAQKFLYFGDVGFFFCVLAFGLAMQKTLTKAGRLSMIILLLYLPLSSIFGLQLTYRTLLLVPFFCMAAAELLRLGQLRMLAAGTLCLALIYVSDPGRTDLIHNRQGAAHAP
jgi:hypothetical protein